MNTTCLDYLHPFLIEGVVQEYAWGMGKNSLVAKLSGQESSNGKYAELWFGDHVNGSARVVGSDSTLREVIAEDPEKLLGKEIVAEYGANLPFLFKILSVGTALSIQTHPDEEFAKILHHRSPEYYKDPFPKPEVGIALSDVELLYGFRPRSEILNFLKTVPEFAKLMEPARLVALKNAETPEASFYQEIYSSVMESESDAIKTCCDALYARLAVSENLTPEELWIQKLQELYPLGDVGLFSFFLLNLVVVPAGKALYIGPNIAHAYLKNELAECMAPSDNVVRAGLTPKFVDRKTLLEMLAYEEQVPCLLSPQEHARSYQGYGELETTNSRYFSVGALNAPENAITFETRERVEMLVAVAGEASIQARDTHLTIPEGRAVVIPASVPTYSVRTSGTAFRVFAKTSK